MELAWSNTKGGIYGIQEADVHDPDDMVEWRQVIGDPVGKSQKERRILKCTPNKTTIGVKSRPSLHIKFGVFLLLWPHLVAYIFRA